MLNLNKHTNTKSKTKPTSNFKNCSHHVCAYHCEQLSYTIQQRTAVLIIFPPDLQIIAITLMLPIGDWGFVCLSRFRTTKFVNVTSSWRRWFKQKVLVHLDRERFVAVHPLTKLTTFSGFWKASFYVTYQNLGEFTLMVPELWGLNLRSVFPQFSAPSGETIGLRRMRKRKNDTNSFIITEVKLELECTLVIV